MFPRHGCVYVDDISFLIFQSNNEFFKRIFDTVEHYKKYGELPAHIKAG